MRLDNKDIIFLSVLFVVLLLVGPSIILDKRINHPSPYGYFAGDGFWFQVYNDVLEEQGKFDKFPPFMSAGFDDVVAHQPPILYHVTSMLRTVGGVQPYDGIYWITMMAAIWACLIFYLFMRQQNQTLAMFGSLLFLWMFSGVFLVKFTWGQWPFILGSTFMAFFFLTVPLAEKHWWLMFISLVGMALSHTSEFLFAAIFLFIVVGIKFVETRKIPFNLLKIYAKAGILATLVSSYYMIIFYFARVSNEGFKIVSPENFEGIKIAFLSSFGFMQWLILAGMIVSIFLLIKKRNMLLMSSLFGMLIGYSYLLGLGKRAFETRSFWPVYLAPFVGISLYLMLKNVKNKKILFASALLLLLGGTQIIELHTTHPGIMNEHVWDGMKWLRETPEDSRILFINGMLFSQGMMLANTHRITFETNLEDVAMHAQAEKLQPIRAAFVFEGAGGLVYRKGLFTFGHHIQEIDEEFLSKPRDLCTMDYIVIPRQDPRQVLLQAYRNIGQFLSDEGFKVVYQNPMIVIMKIDEPRSCA